MEDTTQKRAASSIDEAMGERPPSEERGEIAIVLDGERMVMRPSYEAIEAFEAATGKGLIQLAQAAGARALTLAECAIVMCECIRAWGRATGNKGLSMANPRRIGELVLDSEGGLLEAMSSLTILLALAATGKYTATGEMKPATMTMMEEARVAG